MIRIQKYLLICGALAGGLLSCRHEGMEGHGHVEADIHLISPVEGAAYREGDTVTIEAHVLGTGPLHGYEVFIRKLGDTARIFSREVNDHSQNILVRHQWKNTLTAPASLEALIVVTLDHEDNKATARVGFRAE